MSLVNIYNLGKLSFVIVQDPVDPTDDSLVIHNCTAPSDPKPKYKIEKDKKSRFGEENRISLSFVLLGFFEILSGFHIKLGT